MIARILATLAAIALVCTPLSSRAGNVYRGHGSYVAKGVFVPQTFVVTQFAVPVGVPVAPRSYVYYQAGGCQVMAPPLHQPPNQIPGQIPARQPPPAQPQPVPVQQQPAYQPPPAQPAPQPAPIQQPAPQPQPVPQQPPATPQPEQAAAQPQTMLGQHCATCHKADSHRLTLIDAKSLTCEQKIDAIHRLLSNDPNERMPKGKVLTPEELGLILQELSEPGTATGK